MISEQNLHHIESYRIIKTLERKYNASMALNAILLFVIVYLIVTN